MNTTRKNVAIDGKTYQLEILQHTENAQDSIKVLIPAYMMSEEGFHIVRACIESVRKHTPEKHEIWVIDNNSDPKYTAMLQGIEEIALIRNTTEPINPRLKIKKKGLSTLLPFLHTDSQLKDGSYANAIALEIGCKCINQATNYVMALHSDTIAIRNNWLTHLLGKIEAGAAAAAFFHDKRRIKALHICGILFDYQLFCTYGINFLPNIKQRMSTELPEYDVGDMISLSFREHNHTLYCCKNTRNNPELLNSIPTEIPETIDSDRSFDDNDQVIFMHLGRGTPKSINKYDRPEKLSSNEWVSFADSH